MVRCGSSVMHVAFRCWVVAAIMLSAMGILCLCLISAEVFAVSVSTLMGLKSFSSRSARSFAVSRPSFWSVSW